MRGKITKQIEMTTATLCRLTVENGIPKVDTLEPLTILGKANERAAIKAAKDKHGEGNYSVLKLESTPKAYEMDIEKFIEHATEISPEQAKKNNQ